jgi:subtilisin-like proprotein convertase family protein
MNALAAPVQAAALAALALVLAAPASAIPMSPIWVSSNPAAAIPDNNPGGVSDSIPLAALNIVDVNVDLYVTHTWVGDLSATLTSPDGVIVTLFDRPGVPTSTFGCSSNDIGTAASPVFFDDSGLAGGIEGVCDAGPPAIPGNSYEAFSPGALAAFNGPNSAGNWTINIVDHAGGDTGTLEQWSLHVEFEDTNGDPNGAIPEPTAALIFALGFGVVGAATRRRPR